MENQDRAARPSYGLGGSSSVSGKMHSRGLVNGNGLTNGNRKGMINGNGAVNGLTNGLTNGVSPSSTPKKRSEGPRKRNILVILAIVLILASASIPYFLMESGASEGDIDGSFSEWKNVLSDRAGDSDMDLLSYSSRRYYGGMEFYAEAKDLFNENSTLRALVDTDSSQSTGYLFRGAGVDYLIEISGRDGKVLSAMAYEFNSSRSQYDWNGFNPYASVPYAISGNRIEFGLPIFSGKSDVYFIYSDFNRSFDVSDTPVTGIQGVLRDLAGELISGSSPVAEIEIESHGTEKMEGMEFAISGTTSSVSAELRENGQTIATASSVGNELKFSFQTPLEVSGKRTLQLWVNAENSGDTVKISFMDIEAECGTVASGETSYHYLGQIPSGTVIDGGFAEWKGREIPSPENSENPDVDPEAYALETYNDTVYVYLRVRGDILGGSDIPRVAPMHIPPEKKTNVTVFYGNARPLPPEEGRDFAYILIDTDGNPNTGNPLYGGSEIMVRFSGRGDVHERTYFVWEGKWVERETEVRAYADGSRMEASIPASGNITVYYYLVDWKGDETPVSEMLSRWSGEERETRIFINNDFQISYNDGQNATQPDIAVDPRNPDYIYAVWSEIDETTGIWEIHFSMSDNGGKNWSNDEATEGDRIISASKRAQVSSVGNATMPAIVVDSYENIHVIWCEDYGDGSDEVHYSYSTDFGKTWSSDSGLDWLVSHRYDRPGSLDGEITSLDLDTVTDGNGDVYLYAVWTEYVPELNEQEVRYSWSQGGLDRGWSAADGTDDTIISFPDGQKANNVSITAYPVSGTPNIFVAWDEVDENSGMSEIHYSSSLDGGKTWSGTEKDQILSYPAKDGRNARKPCISGAEGVLFALWQQEYDPSQGYLWTEIFYSVSTDNGGTWSGQEGDKYISYPDKNPALNVSAAIIPGTKEAHAVWQEYAEEYGSVEIHHSYFDGTTWSGTKADEILSNPDRENATNPSMVWSPAGRMEIVWSEPNPPKASSFNDEIIYSNPVPEFGNIFFPVLSVLLLVFFVFPRKRRNK